MSHDATGLWQFSDASGLVSGADLVGYAVDAGDGHIGKVHRLSEEVDASHLVVDTGPWIFGKHVLLPAGTVLRIDHEEERIQVARTKDEIKHAPEYVPDPPAGTDYRDQYTHYYAPFGGGPLL
ncbi:PRC-barrel domain-containing protein [Kitasatospora sp. NPDC004289]